jgi:hypothetical protein
MGTSKGSFLITSADLLISFGCSLIFAYEGLTKSILFLFSQTFPKSTFGFSSFNYNALAICSISFLLLSMFYYTLISSFLSLMSVFATYLFCSSFEADIGRFAAIANSLTYIFFCFYCYPLASDRTIAVLFSVIFDSALVTLVSVLGGC